MLVFRPPVVGTGTGTRGVSEENWARIWEIFTEARDMEPAARARMLEDLPPEMAAEVRSLIDEEIAQPSGPAPEAPQSV